MNANLASIMPQVDRRLVRGRRATTSRSSATPAREDLLERAARRRRPRLHRRVHRGRPARLRAEQPLPPARGGHRAGRPARPLLSRGRRGATSTTSSASPTGAWSTRCSQDCAPHRPSAACLGASGSRRSCRACASAGSSSSRRSPRRPPIKIVPMIGSLGCPYTCSFCIDSTVDYQPLGLRGVARRPPLPAHQDAAARSSAGTIRTSASASTTT